ncbi:MAG: HPr kinase [Rhodomicrobium sp.]|nr:MAG: HPr kinase [Rhodomicrobium sp.]
MSNHITSSTEIIDGEKTLLHATLIRVNNKGVLLIGPSGAGKSDLALRLITTQFAPSLCSDQPVLIADDQVILQLTKQGPSGRAPTTLSGLIEVRGLGIMQITGEESSSIDLIAQLRPKAEIKRMPVENSTYELVEGVELPLIELDPTEASAPAKIILATQRDAT